MGKVINDYEIKEIALNPVYMTNDDLESLKNQGFRVRWMREDEADEWVELSDEFYKGCDNVRDQYMVDHCDVLLAIWDGNKSGGVWSTIRKAQKAGKKIIYCPKEILSEE